MCAVYRGSVCKLCRREGEKLFLKGQRCLTAKCSVEKRAYAPGQHGQMRTRETEYGIQLREKQKLKRAMFMTEKQFRKFFKASEKEEGPTGTNLLIKLECRLDNIVKRFGFTMSVNQARQMVLHGMISVNGRTCSIPSYVVKEGDEIEIRKKYKDSAMIKETVEENEGISVPEWLEFNTSTLSGKVLRLPTRDEITLAGGDIQENLIVELYSK